METTEERIDSETAEKLIWALKTLDGQPKGCLTCGEGSDASQELIAATLTKEEIEKLSEVDRHTDGIVPPFDSSHAARELFKSCIRLEEFIEALRKLAQE
jgi:hypothetical protein